MTLATMESCSGGFLANSITDIPGCADYYKGGIVATSPAMLRANGVSAEALKQHGTVSPQAAMAMAAAARESMGADYGIAITGVLGAGPGGGTAGRPGLRRHRGLERIPPNPVSDTPTPYRNQAPRSQHGPDRIAKADCGGEHGLMRKAFEKVPSSLTGEG